MKLYKTAITILFTTGLLNPVVAIAGPDDSILDEITIRVMDSDNMSINVTDIALPNIAGDHKMELPDAAHNANDHAQNASENASEAAQNASDHASSALESAAEVVDSATSN